MMRIKTLILPLVFLFCALPMRAAEAPIPAAPTRWVTDNAGFLSSAARRELDVRLQAFEAATGHQVIVWIGTSTGDTPTEDWTVRAFAKWKVGRKGLDDGLVLFVFKDDRKVRVEVGYGLEDKVPDALASRVIRDVIVPKIQAGDNDGALLDGTDALLRLIGGVEAGAAGTASAQPRRESPPARQFSLGQIILFVILGIGFIILLITNPTLALYLLFSILSGGRGGGGGGGFSGGGGSSGGGGATGSW
jgi:uncharacterized protein